MKHLRNWGIVLLLTIAVYALPGGGTAAELVQAILFITITAGIGLLGAKVYLENRSTIYALGDQWRAVLYGSIGLLVLLMAGTTRMFDTGLGTLLWIVLLGTAIYGLVAVVRQARAY